MNMIDPASTTRTGRAMRSANLNVDRGMMFMAPLKLHPPAAYNQPELEGERNKSGDSETSVTAASARRKAVAAADSDSTTTSDRFSQPARCQSSAARASII